MEERIANTLKSLTLQEKIKLCSGSTFWKTEEMSEKGIASVFMSDGPHGLRTQKGASDHLGINKSEKSTCFPTASASAASWNPKLLQKMGEAIGEEALYHEVDVVLGPGVCMKRNPLCGRNFEYFSEDPYLSGEMGKNWVLGVQSRGIGTSLKHFACNNQEKDRMSGNSMVDERTLREIYLPAFEMTVKGSQPDTIMCSYNQINGTFASDNKKLLTEILREEWGYQGLVVTDWGAMNDRVAATKAGCDLEMPTSNGFFDGDIEAAIGEGRLTEAELDACVARVLRLAFKAQKTREEYQVQAKDGGKEAMMFDAMAHHTLAREIEEESAVLLKNEDHILPLNRKAKVALCGKMAQQVRYQGAGSSHINPIMLSDIKSSMETLGRVAYYPAYEIDGSRNEAYLQEAIAGAREADYVVVAVGLPDSYESEGYDRSHMKMPESHCELIREVAKVNDRVVVLLMGGSPVELPWLSDAKAVLNLYLGGQAVGEAAANLIYGLVSPSGKLAETYPISYEDCVCSETFGVNPRQVEYAEGLYVGYRYYDKAKVPVQFPFGYGLSYTSFELSDFKVEGSGPDFVASCVVKNVGACAGAEVVQLYVADKTPGIYKAVKELKGFCKVALNPGEAKEVKIYLDKRSFAHYDVDTKNWEVLTGDYEILFGTSSANLAGAKMVHVEGTVSSMKEETIPAWYKNPVGKPGREDFVGLYGVKVEPYRMEGPGEYTLLNTFHDMEANPIVAGVAGAMKAGILQQFGGDETNGEYIFTIAIVMNTPLIRLVQQQGDLGMLAMMKAVVGAANGNQEAIAALMQMGQQ